MSHLRRSISLLYVDKGLVVCNKPPGLVCQLENKPSTSTEGPIGAEPYNLNFYFNQVRRRLRLDDHANLYPIHRLDKDTTGCLFIALSQRLAKELQKQTEAGEIRKSYLALARASGQSFRLPPTGRNKILAPIPRSAEDTYLPAMKGRITTHITTEPNGRSKYCKSYDKGAKLAITDWEVLQCSPKAPISLIRFDLVTGLKHQIRLHSALCLRAPLLGDTTHGATKLHNKVSSATSVPADRLLLHASQMSFIRHTPSPKNVSITAPLPLDFVKICADLDIELPSEVVEGGLWVDGIKSFDVPQVDGHWRSKASM